MQKICFTSSKMINFTKTLNDITSLGQMTNFEFYKNILFDLTCPKSSKEDKVIKLDCKR